MYGVQDLVDDLITSLFGGCLWICWWPRRLMIARFLGHLGTCLGGGVSDNGEAFSTALGSFQINQYWSTLTSLSACRHIRGNRFLAMFCTSRDDFHYNLTILKLERNVPALGNILLAFYVACSCKQFMQLQKIIILTSRSRKLFDFQ